MILGSMFPSNFSFRVGESKMFSLKLSAVLAAILMSAAPVAAGAADDAAPGAPEKVAAVSVEAEAASASDDGSAPAAAVSTAATGNSAAEAPPPAPVPTTLTASINLATQTMVVSERGKALYTWKISSGTRTHATPRGTFSPQWTAKMWNSRKYDWAPMPHSVFIHGGVAIHGTQHVGALGRPASKGCIRLAPANARTFYNLVQRHGMKATKVTIQGTPNWGSQYVASNQPRRQRKPVAQPTYGFWDGFGASSSAYDQQFLQKKPKKRQAGQNRPFRIVRGPDGKPRRVYLSSQYSGYAAGSW
jgi:lipoprotein-anchoring transpeptidase ErfK/SrfK